MSGCSFGYGPSKQTFQRKERIKAKKSNKNMSPYWCWYLEIGRSQFYRKYGRAYNQDCDDDKALITELWDPVKEAWENKIKNKSGDMRGVIRQFHVDDRMANQSVVKRRSTSQRPPNFPLPICRCESIEQYDIRARRECGKRDLMDKLRFFDARKVDFSSEVLQFIAVYPYTAALSSVGDILVYPAEVAVAHFTLASGKSACWSKLISFHSNVFYGGGIPVWDQNNIVHNATSLDVPLKESIGTAPQQVWKMLCERRSARAITVCDANQMLMVDRALFFLACTAGEAQLPLHEELVSTMVTAQDLVAVLALHKAKKAHNPVPEILTDDSIEKEFKRLRETCICCSYHANRAPNHPSRQLCAVAKIDILIDSICTLCLSGDLANFRVFYNADIHSSEIVDIGGFQDECDRTPVKNQTTTTLKFDDASPEHEDKGESPRGFVLDYRVVKTVPESSPEKARATVDLITVISRLLRDPSMLPVNRTLI
ncbi:hypothetical protein RB195_019926 [Necator americanus]|uniref:Maelstrom domain-containing protein n=1 Tax=Necator americanus TaxID=51031 RepID=A0ABR1CGD7_NECAM